MERLSKYRLWGEAFCWICIAPTLLVLTMEVAARYISLLRHCVGGLLLAIGCFVAEFVALLKLRKWNLRFGWATVARYLGVMCAFFLLLGSAMGAFAAGYCLLYRWG